MKVSAANMTAEQRAIAEVRAAKCFTCSLFSSELDPSRCLGCSTTPTPGSCCPGYCPACAHDPRWIPLSEVLP